MIDACELPTGAATAVGFADTANPAKPTSVTTPSGDELSMSYDDAGNLTSAVQEDMDIDVTSLSYTGQGLLSSTTDAGGNTTEFSYDSVGNLIEMAEPGPIGTTIFGYDTLSRVTSVTDGNGITLDYGYDRLDRIVSISHDDDVPTRSPGSCSPASSPTATPCWWTWTTAGTGCP